VGQQVDFDNSRLGSGASVDLEGTIRPTDHLALAFVGVRSWLNVDASGSERRLFVAQVERLKATYVFTSRAFLRVIGQYVSTRRDPSLYTSSVTEHDATFSGSALFAYKINWQTVMFLGYGDNRTLVDNDHYEKAGRQFFLKLSYAFQR
jgi:hypothetical protein